MNRIERIGEAAWRIGDTHFAYGFERGSSAESFFIRKPADLVENYSDLTPEFVHANVVELGVADGGSTAMLALLLEPRRLVACDVDPRRLRGLDDFIAKHALTSAVRPYLGVDQADRVRLGEIVDREFGPEPLDLVIDDASHKYHATCASFEVLFPRLRERGLYIIEDWPWAETEADKVTAVLNDPASPTYDIAQQTIAQALADGETESRLLPPLSRVGVELLQVTARRNTVVDTLLVDGHWLGVRRGSARLDPTDFRLADHYTDHWGWLQR